MLDESTLAIYRRMRLPLVACRGKGYAFSGLYMPTPYSTLCEWPRQVGLLTGYPFYGGKLLVMDVDPRNHGDESLAKLIAKFGPLPYTAHQRTPSGGDHYFFVVPADLEIPQDLPDLPGIDVFSQQNHHILIAPSTFNRNSYSWEVPIWDTVAECPEHLLYFARLWSRKPEDEPPVAFVGRTAPRPALPLNARGKAKGKPTRYMSSAQDLIQRFPIAAGNRHKQTVRAATSLVCRGVANVERMMEDYCRHFASTYGSTVAAAIRDAKSAVEWAKRALEEERLVEAVPSHLERTVVLELSAERRI